LDDYRLEVVFFNRERRIFDVKPYLPLPAFRGVAEDFVFARVAGLSVAWKSGADINPDELYHAGVGMPGGT
jgi:hypothetical protein